eukprot:1591024-Prorocentrum_lima.AAC.1
MGLPMEPRFSTRGSSNAFSQRFNRSLSIAMPSVYNWRAKNWLFVSHMTSPLARLCPPPSGT